MSKSEIPGLIEEYVENSNDGWHEVDYWGSVGPYGKPREPEYIPGVGDVYFVSGYTGGEGGGESCEAVLKVVDADGTVSHWQKNGYYLSNDGTTWDGDIFEVKPVEVMRVEYVKA